MKELHKQTAIARAKEPYRHACQQAAAIVFANLNEWHYFPESRMPIQQLPMMKGMGKDFKNADYIDYLPINMLATPKEVLNSSGYLRSFPA